MFKSLPPSKYPYLLVNHGFHAARRKREFTDRVRYFARGNLGSRLQDLGSKRHPDNGALVAAFSTSSVKGFPTVALSVALIAAAVALHATSEQVTSIAYDRIEEIEHYLKIAGPTRLFESKIADQWWYVARRNVAYVLFTVLESVYLYLVYPNIFVFIVALWWWVWF